VRSWRSDGDEVADPFPRLIHHKLAAQHQAGIVDSYCRQVSDHRAGGYLFLEIPVRLFSAYHSVTLF
jgi:hypothetical protein